MKKFLIQYEELGDNHDLDSDNIDDVSDLLPQVVIQKSDGKIVKNNVSKASYLGLIRSLAIGIQINRTKKPDYNEKEDRDLHLVIYYKNEKWIVEYTKDEKYTLDNICPHIYVRLKDVKVIKEEKGNKDLGFLLQGLAFCLTQDPRFRNDEYF